MDKAEEKMQEYWDGRFRREGRVWGNLPSRTAAYAARLFRDQGAEKILIPGAGYGRNAAYFAAAGFAVDGIEISPAALSLAEEGTGVKYYLGSVLDMPCSGTAYDAVYCFNVLHLFRRADRDRLIQNCLQQLKAGGMLFFTVFSEVEPSFGRGNEVEPNTFESKPGRPVHYFTAADLREHFAGGRVVDAGLMDDPENHGEEGEHIHRVRYIAVQYDGPGKRAQGAEKQKCTV